MKRYTFLAGTGLMLALMACGGGGGGSTTTSTPPAPATPTASTLTYTDPASSGWRFVKDASSTSSHLVLNLMGPSGSTGHGVAFTLNVDQTKATWAKVQVADTEYVKNVAYNLGTGSQFYKGKVQGNNLLAGVFQKGVGGAAVAYSSGVLARVALDIVPGQAVNTAIPIGVSGSQELTGSGMGVITIAMGTLTAQ